MPDGKAEVRPLVHFVAGGVGGTVGAVLTCPLEVVKTRLQSSLYRSHHLQHKSGVVPMLRSIYVNEGARALWKGIGPNLVGVIPARAIYFSTYAYSKDYLINHLAINRGQDSPLIQLISAAVAGIATGSATNPIWVVKTRMQLQKTRIEQQQKGGISGAAGSSSGRSSSSSLPIAKSPPASTLMSALPSTASTAVAPAQKMVAAGMATRADAAAIATDVPYYRNSFECLLQICRKEGVRGLFRGLSASYLGIAESTIQWVTYEQLKKWTLHASVAQQQHRKSISTTATSRQQQQQQQGYAQPPPAGSSEVDQVVEAPLVSSLFLNTLGTAGMAKLLAAMLTYPHEVLRTRLRQVVSTKSIDPHTGKTMTQHGAKYRGLVHCATTIMREEGALAFYGGMSAHLLRTVPNTAIMFCCYEAIVYFFSRGEQQ